MALASAAGCKCRLLCLLALAFHCSAYRAGEPSGKQLGEQLGAKVLAADNEVQADAAQNDGKSVFQNTYAETLTSNEMVLVNPAVSKVLQQVNGLAQSLVAQDGLCERRWASACPDGWSLTAGDQCAAPSHYGGACKKVQSFQGMSVLEKQQFAEDCKAPWPCDDTCQEGHDYSDLCPLGWHSNGNGFCEAPADFKTKCATSYDFAEMDLRTRQELARTCGFQWKCQGTCQQDFSRACPEEWAEVPMNPGVCTAPATYTGLCSFSINTATLTDDQKSAFAQKCAARFPCLGRVDAGTQVPISPGGNQPLPEGPVQGTRREQ